jgi:MFS family permease
MLSPYRDVLSRPGAWRFSSAAVLARLPMSMVGIGVVLMVQQLYGSYALAGQVAGAYVIAQSLCAPVLAALVDRRGQATVMRPALLLSTAGLAALVAAGMVRAPAGWLLLAAVVAGGGMGSFGAMVRARWTLLLRDEPGPLHTAYSLESALDEVVFVIGPVAATVLATSVHPAAGLVLPVVAMLIGGWWFLAQHRTAPLPAPAGTPRPRGTVLTVPGMMPLLLVFLAIGVIFGGTDVSTVALATEVGHKGWAGVVLAGFALGSLTAGLIYGARPWVSPLHRRFVIGAVALALGVSTFVLVSTLGALTAAMVVTGLSIAPTVINGNALVQALVPPGRLTEGLTWVGTSIGLGVSVGSAVAGSAIDAIGSRGGFLVVVAAGLLVVLAAAVGAPSLARQAAVHRPSP